LCLCLFALGHTHANEVQGRARLGFIGSAGIMGNGMSRRLLESFDLIIWNRNITKSMELHMYSTQRVTVASSPRELVESSDITLSMLPTPEASRQVFEGPDGVLAGIRKDKSIVDCATLRPADMKRMHDAVKAKGGRFLEAPVSGSKVPAQLGQLVFLAAGDQSLYKDIEEALALMGKAQYFLGEVGAGTAMKLVVNKIMGEMMASLAEGMLLAEKSLLEPSQLIEVLSLAAIANPMFALKGPKIAQGDYAPHFPLKHASKDLQFAMEMATERGVPSKMAEAAQHMLTDAITSGHGDKDFSAVHAGLQQAVCKSGVSEGEL